MPSTSAQEKWVAPVEASESTIARHRAPDDLQMVTAIDEFAETEPRSLRLGSDRNEPTVPDRRGRRGNPPEAIRPAPRS
jgi:hypothetical protein